jgi:hypothetical protein
MELTLFYRGTLKANGDATHKHQIRKIFSPQIRRRFPQPPGALQFVVKSSNNVSLPYVAPITRAMRMTADLKITFLRPSAPGNLIQHGGDIDNRLKTLFDALRCPAVDEVPEAEWQEIAEAAANPNDSFRCLLEDDALISSLSVRTDRLLDVDPNEKPNEVVLAIHVTGITHDAIQWIPGNHAIG